MKKSDSMQDMTSGSPRALILAFAIPMLLGTLFQQFYSMVDTIIIGRTLGVDALAGVGSTSAVNFMINGFVIGACSGFAIPVAQRFGAQDYSGMRRYVGNIIWLTIVFSAVMTAVIAMLTSRILRWMNTPENIFAYAYEYIFIIFLGIPVTFLYNITASVIRSLGDSRTPVYFLVFAALLNILLDYISIMFLGFGVNGPAYATCISQGLSGLMCLLYMVHKFPALRFQQGNEAGPEEVRHPFEDGSPYGTAVFHYSHRLCGAADSGEWPGFRLCGLHHSGREDRKLLHLGL